MKKNTEGGIFRDELFSGFSLNCYKRKEKDDDDVLCCNPILNKTKNINVINCCSYF